MKLKHFTIKKGSILHDLIRNRALYLLALPSIIWFIVFRYTPMVGIIIAFKEFNVVDGIFGSPWAGIKNFRFMFLTNDIWRVTKNTLFLNALFLSAGLICSVGIALLINEIRNVWFKKITQGLMLLPYFMSWVIIGAISYYILGSEGLINSFFKAVGLNPVRFYFTPELWPGILTFSSVWKGIGFSSIIYLSAITGVDQEIYESAVIDGCNRFQQAIYMTLPCIVPTIIIMLLLAIGSIFYGDFGMIINMAKGTMLYKTTDIIDTYVFRALRERSNFGLASAAGFFQSVFGFITVVTFNKIVTMYDRDYALF